MSRLFRSTGVLLLLCLLLSNVQSQATCVGCPPRLPISVSTIASLGGGIADGPPPIDIAFHPNSQHFLTITTPSLFESDRELPNFLSIWTIIEEEEFVYWDKEFSLNANDTLRHVAFSRISDVMAAGEDNGVLSFWDMKQRRILSVRLWDETAITDLVFHPKDNLLVAVGNHQQVRVYPVEAENHPFVELPLNAGFVSNVAFNADGTIMVIGVDETVTLWSVQDLFLINSFSVADETVQRVLLPSQQPDTIITIAGAKVKRWKWDGKELSNALQFDIPALETTDLSVTAADLSADGSVLITVYNKKEVIVWATDTGDLIDVPILSVLHSERDPRDIYSVGFSPDGMWLMFGTGFGMVYFIVA